MKLWILGSGTAVPNMLRAPACFLLEGREKRILLDAGSCVLLRLEQAGIDFRQVDAVYLSHFHPDHCAGLVPLLFAHYCPDGTPRRDPLVITGSVGISALMDNLRRAFGDWLVPKSFKVEVREAREHVFADGEFEVSVVFGSHSESSLAYRFRDRAGKVLVYSGDTPYSASIVNLACEADLLLLECSFPAGTRAPGHLSADDAGRMAAAARAKKLVLTHFYPPCRDADVKAQAAEHFKGEIVVAQDLMLIEF